MDPVMDDIRLRRIGDQHSAQDPFRFLETAKPFQQGPCWISSAKRAVSGCSAAFQVARACSGWPIAS
jgi:hypothetical protein